MNNQYHIKRFLTLLLTIVPFVLASAEQTNSKFAMTTRLFLDEFNHTGQAAAPGRPEVDRPATHAIGNVVAAPVYEDGVAYISCFIHLADPTDPGVKEGAAVYQRSELEYMGQTEPTESQPPEGETAPSDPVAEEQMGEDDIIHLDSLVIPTEDPEKIGD